MKMKNFFVFLTCFGCALVCAAEEVIPKTEENQDKNIHSENFEIVCDKNVTSAWFSRFPSPSPLKKIEESEEHGDEEGKREKGRGGRRGKGQGRRRRLGILAEIKIRGKKHFGMVSPQSDINVEVHNKLEQEAEFFIQVKVLSNDTSCGFGSFNQSIKSNASKVLSSHQLSSHNIMNCEINYEGHVQKHNHTSILYTTPACGCVEIKAFIAIGHGSSTTTIIGPELVPELNRTVCVKPNRLNEAEKTSGGKSKTKKYGRKRNYLKKFRRGRKNRKQHRTHPRRKEVVGNLKFRKLRWKPQHHENVVDELEASATESNAIYDSYIERGERDAEILSNEIFPENEQLEGNGATLDDHNKAVENGIQELEQNNLIDKKNETVFEEETEESNIVNKDYAEGNEDKEQHEAKVNKDKDELEQIGKEDIVKNETEGNEDKTESDKIEGSEKNGSDEEDENAVSHGSEKSVKKKDENKDGEDSDESNLDGSGDGEKHSDDGDSEENAENSDESDEANSGESNEDESNESEEDDNGSGEGKESDEDESKEISESEGESKNEDKEKDNSSEEDKEKDNSSEEDEEKDKGSNEEKEKDNGSEKDNSSEEDKEKDNGSDEDKKTGNGSDGDEEKENNSDENNEKDNGSDEDKEKANASDDDKGKGNGSNEGEEKDSGSDEEKEKDNGSDEDEEKGTGSDEENEKENASDKNNVENSDSEDEGKDGKDNIVEKTQIPVHPRVERKLMHKRGRKRGFNKAMKMISKESQQQQQQNINDQPWQFVKAGRLCCRQGIRQKKLVIFSQMSGTPPESCEDIPQEITYWATIKFNVTEEFCGQRYVQCCNMWNLEKGKRHFRRGMKKHLHTGDVYEAIPSEEE